MIITLFRNETEGIVLSQFSNVLEDGERQVLTYFCFDISEIVRKNILLNISPAINI